MRISTTTLESFRLFMEPEQEWMSEDELLATIRGEFVPTHIINIGQAFGLILRNPERYRVSGGYRVTPRGTEDVIELGDDVMQPALDRLHPDAVFEAKAVGIYAGHEVVAKADQLRGARIIETKARFSSFDFDKYALSCQWRFMLDIFQAALVEYQVYCLLESKQNQRIELKDVETFHLFRYADIHDDCERLVRAFATYVEAKGLTGLLDARQAELAGAF